jgi:hypothetical protein
MAAWDISTAIYTGNSYDASGLTTVATGLFFKPDGLAFWTNGDDDVFEFSIASAWDLSSSVALVRSYSYLAQENTSRDVFFKSDGTKMFIVGDQNNAILEYALSTAWDVSSASFTTSADVSGQETVPRSVFFKDDGTKFYITGLNSARVHEYALSTAWDLSTASYTTLFNPTTQAGSPISITFKSDGSKMYVLDLGKDVYQYALSTAWDVTSASYESKFLSTSAQVSTPLNSFFKPDGEEFYVVDNSDTIFQYTTTSTTGRAVDTQAAANSVSNVLSLNSAAVDPSANSVVVTPAPNALT